MNDLKKDFVSNPTQVKKGKNKYARCFITRVVIQFCPDMEVGKFTAMLYRVIQSHLVKIAQNPHPREPEKKSRTWSRQYVNRLMKILRAVFKWGISFDLVLPEVLAKIQSVPPVKAGEYASLYPTNIHIIFYHNSHLFYQQITPINTDYF